MTRDWTMAPLHRRPHESPMPDSGFNQTALLCLDIAARHRREIDIEAARELALRRQSIQGSKLAAADILRDGVGDGKIARFAKPRQKRHPLAHFSLRAKVFGSPGAN